MLDYPVNRLSFPANPQQLPYFHILRTIALSTSFFSHPYAKTPGGGSFSHLNSQNGTRSLQIPTFLRQATARFPEIPHAFTKASPALRLRRNSLVFADPRPNSHGDRRTHHRNSRRHSHRRNLE